ncbi:glycine--tRNA ligase subunit beta [Candidatus Moduliflexota bacterium]
MGKELVLEVGCEEIPARFIANALASLREKAESSLRGLRLEHGAIRTAGTPRRLAVCVEDLAERQEELVREVTGPARSAAYDSDGNLTKAGLGFARSLGVDPGELTVKSLPKGEYLAGVRREKGRDSADILREVLPGWLISLRFPKSMRWGNGDLRFARPIHWILALYGGNVLDFEVEGIISGNRSRGHRFLSPAAFEVKGWNDYLEGMKNARVIADPKERRELIAEQIAEAAVREGGTVSPDEDLLDTVTNLVEYPVAVCGSFDEDFLELPEEVLVTEMKFHQKYFTVRDGEGRLMARFIAVSNITCDDGMKIVREGNERVLRARLADGRFFFQEDGKVPLENFVSSLEKVVYQEKLGSYREKVARVEGMSVKLAGQIGCDPGQAARAARLSKADLVTQMVGEFPELQGVMGREYALKAGEAPEVAMAIFEQYLPRHSGDELPSGDLGAVLSIAERIDSIVGIFGIGEAPTGSEDPYGMRRHTLAIINIIMERSYPIELSPLIEEAIRTLQGKTDRPGGELLGEVRDFFGGRLENLFTGDGHPPDVVRAVLAAGFERLPEVRKKIAALTDFRSRAEFLPLATVFKRAANIVPEGFSGGVDPALFAEGEERELHDAVSGLEGDVRQLVVEENYRAALVKMAAIQPVLDRFFEKVLVMAEEDAVKTNRLALVQGLASLFSGIADFRQISV